MYSLMVTMATMECSFCSYNQLVLDCLLLLFLIYFLFCRFLLEMTMILAMVMDSLGKVTMECSFCSYNQLVLDCLLLLFLIYFLFFRFLLGWR